MENTKITIANPIYDSVFKYLIADERVARTLLSALLKKKVLSVEARPHEYANDTRDGISMFRVDFSARIQEDDGSEHLILIELQKTWLETETLRFRQYLGAQYSDRNNIKKDSRQGFAIPMVTIYLLGHRVGDIEVPVLYVNHKSYDYDGNEVTHGMPDPFVESLVHNSIIVQIPLLHGQINNRLDRVLSVFDQTKTENFNNHILELDGSVYAGDADLEYLVRRLTKAAASSSLRQDMNVEDEYYSAIENRDTALMAREKRIKEQDIVITEQSNKIAEQGNKIAEQGNKIAEQGNKIAEQDNKIAEQGDKIAEQGDKIAEQEKVLCLLVRQLYEKGMTTGDIARMTDRDEDEIRHFVSGEY